MAPESKSFQVVLQGEVGAKHISSFLERLRGLVGETGLKEEIARKEFVYAYDAQCPNYIPTAYHVRVREVLSGSPTFRGEGVEGPSWELHYVGRFERKNVGDTADTVQYRNIIAISVRNNVSSFLQTLGFRQTYSFMQFGTRWILPDFTLELTQIKTLDDPTVNQNKAFDELENIGASARLLEICAITSDAHIDKVSQDIRRFATDLAPYFIEREREDSGMSHSTATLAAEMRRKRVRE